jgi:Sigma-70 region 2
VLEGWGDDRGADRAGTGRGRAGVCQLTDPTDPYRRELHVHCYRILGSVQDAEDALQETLLAAWRGLGGFQQRSSVRTGCIRSPPTAASTRCEQPAAAHG